MTGLTVVAFVTATGRCAIAVEQVLAVRPATELRPVPRGRPGVVGLLHEGADDAVVTVVDALGPGREHVLVLAGEHGPFGLHVEQVTGLLRLRQDEVGPPPAGQRDDVVTGLVRHDGDVVLIVDAQRLGRVLWPQGEQDHPAEHDHPGGQREPGLKETPQMSKDKG